METQGFYKNDNGHLLHGPNYVLNSEYQLLKEEKYTYTLPIDGWYWFDDEESAYMFFGVEKPTDENLTPNNNLI